MKKNPTLIGAGIGIAMLVAIVLFNVIGKQSAGNDAWKEVRADVLPQLIESSRRAQMDIVSKELSEQVDIGFVINDINQYTYITSGQLAEYDITADDLYKQALDNLEEISKNVDLTLFQSGEGIQGKYVIVELEDAYSAVRLLSTRIQNTLKKELGNTYLVAIPTRDFLIAWRQDFPLHDEFLTQVQTEFNTDTEYPLSPYPFLVTPAGIQPLTSIPK